MAAQEKSSGPSVQQELSAPTGLGIRWEVVSHSLLPVISQRPSLRSLYSGQALGSRTHTLEPSVPEKMKHLRLASRKWGISAFVEEWEAKPLFATQKQHLNREQSDRLRAERLHQDPHGLAASLRGMGSGVMPFLSPDRLASIQVPALVLAGSLDSKFCAIGKSLAKSIPEAQFSSIDSAGHAAHLERHEAVAECLNHFFSAAE